MPPRIRLFYSGLIAVLLLIPALALYRELAGGVTTSLLLHGSANMIGGQAVVIKHKYGAARDEMLFPGAPASIKFASGENPKRVYGSKDQLPSTRMGNFAVQREALSTDQRV